MKNVAVTLAWFAGLFLLPYCAILAISPFLPTGFRALQRDPWECWQLTPSITLPLILVAALYIAGLKRKETDGPARGTMLRPLAFFAGLGALFVALQSPIEEIADHSLSVHHVEHMLLGTVAPILLILAEPEAPFMRGMPSWLRRGVVGPMISNSLVRGSIGFFLRPVPATLSFIGITWFGMLPYYHDLALRSETVHYLWHATLLLSGLIFFSRVLDPRAAPLGLGLGLRLLMIWCAEMGNITLGFYLTFKSHVIYKAYEQLGLLWGVSPLRNEIYGGQTVWIPGSMMLAAAALAVIYRWAEKEELTEHYRRRRTQSVRIETRDFLRQVRPKNRALALGLASFVALVLILLVLLVGFYERSFEGTFLRRACTAMAASPC